MERSITLPLGGRLELSAPLADSPGTVLICPGGAYEWLSPREAGPVADAFRNGGWDTALFTYTVHTPGGEPLGTLPLRQLGEAVACLRQAGDGRVVVCGFSAGGHLAASLGVHWRSLELPRPDALILAYPVITEGRFAHQKSIDNLTGGEKDGFFSLETKVGPQVPPVFLWHTVTDPEVPVNNSLLFAQALIEAGVSCELHLYPYGVHGLSLATPEVEEPVKDRFADPHIAGWFDNCLCWLDALSRKGVF